MMKPFAAEQADADLPLERDADRDAARRAEERVLLADQLPPSCFRSIARILPGYGARERHLLLAAAPGW